MNSTPSPWTIRHLLALTVIVAIAMAIFQMSVTGNTWAAFAFQVLLAGVVPIVALAAIGFWRLFLPAWEPPKQERNQESPHLLKNGSQTLSLALPDPTWLIRKGCAMVPVGSTVRNGRAEGQRAMPGKLDFWMWHWVWLLLALGVPGNLLAQPPSNYSMVTTPSNPTQISNRKLGPTDGLDVLVYDN
ncbi:MAG: hypothetical protein ACKN9U_23960, partial [Pirellulaceae bacterium]